MQNFPTMICGLTQSCDLQMMINHPQLNDFQSKINTAFGLWNGTIEFICRRERARRAEREIWGVAQRAQISHRWNIYKHTPAWVCSAPFVRSNDGWSQPDQHFKRADESLVSCMLIGCLVLTRPFRSIRGEYGGSTPCFGMYWLFSSSWKEPYQIPAEPWHPPPTHPPPRARERTLQGWCDKINLVLTALSPLPAARGARVYWSK